MNILASLAPEPALATGRIVQAVADHNDRASSFTTLAVIVAVLVFLAGIWAMLNWLGRLASQRSVPATLFDELATVHGLDRVDREVLRAVARRCGLAEPAMVFVRPDAIVAARAPGGPHAGRLDALHRRLFAG